MRQGQLAVSQEEEPVSSAGEANAILVPVGLHVDMLAVGCSHSWLPKFCWTGGRLASGKGVQSYHSTTLLGWKDLVFRLSGPIPGEPRRSFQGLLRTLGLTSTYYLLTSEYLLQYTQGQLVLSHGHKNAPSKIPRRGGLVLFIPVGVCISTFK